MTMYLLIGKCFAKRVMKHCDTIKVIFHLFFTFYSLGSKFMPNISANIFRRFVSCDKSFFSESYYKDTSIYKSLCVSGTRF